MVNDPGHSDVQFICSDGGSVHACRWLLVAWSSVLKSMLTNGMGDSRLTEIALPDITTQAMLTTVEYLYTETIVRHKLTLGSAFQAIHASRFLMLVNLEKCVMGALVTAVAETVKDADLEILIWCFTQLAELNTEEKDMANNSPTADLVCDMAYKLQAMDSYDPLNNLSVQAFNLYLDATTSENSTTVSFKEYLRLRSILLWACTRVSLPAGELLKVCLPDEKYLRVAFQTYKLSCTFPIDADGSCLEPGVIRELQTWVEKLDSGWSRVKIHCIHPVILVEILEPLGIIPQSLYLSALKYQAVHAGEMNILKWCPPFEGCETEQNGLVIRCVRDLPNEDCILNMIMNHGLCEWEFLVVTPCSYLNIGLQQPPNYTSPKSWALSQYGSIIGEKNRYYSEEFCQAGSKVRVHLDMNLRTCSFTIDGQKFGDAWVDLPEELYPKISLCPPGRVRVQLVSDVNFI